MKKIFILGYEMKHSWLIYNNCNVLFILFHIILTHHDYRLNELQLKFLEELRMIEIMKALKTFVIWLQEGMYDFSSLPVTLKEDLCDCHIQELNQATAVSEGNGVITYDAVSIAVIYIYISCIIIYVLPLFFQVNCMKTSCNFL